MTNKMCPRCRHLTLKPAGKIRAGPRGGLRTMRKCWRCNYRCFDKRRKTKVTNKKSGRSYTVNEAAHIPGGIEA